MDRRKKQRRAKGPGLRPRNAALKGCLSPALDPECCHCSNNTYIFLIWEFDWYHAGLLTTESQSHCQPVSCLTFFFFFPLAFFMAFFYFFNFPLSFLFGFLVLLWNVVLININREIMQRHVNKGLLIFPFCSSPPETTNSRSLWCAFPSLSHTHWNICKHIITCRKGLWGISFYKNIMIGYTLFYNFFSS